MSSKRFKELAHKISIEKKAVLDTLLEFEKTKKIVTKTRLNFTVDKGVAQKFRKYCRDHGYNMSAKVEEAMEKIST
ncbi:MAG: hypothetical protein KJ601_06410 [Nanoarchaeota archaeon]|nr:hypothetical protein [Nanoarchaeota archaeon]